MIKAADALLSSARSVRNLTESLAVYTKAADAYNDKAGDRTDALTSLRRQGPGGTR